MKLIGYGCTSSAGKGVKPFWESLNKEHSHAQIISPELLKNWTVLPSPIPKLCAWDADLRKNTVQETLLTQLVWAWQEACAELDEKQKKEMNKSLGVILASTKGIVEDFIWDPSSENREQDPLMPLLSSFLQRTALETKKNLCVSNACASSHAAIFLAKKWLENKRVTHVLVLAADFMGPFIVNGFQALKALSKDTLKSFSADRDGLVLGDAAAALLFSNADFPSAPFIEEIAIDNEGYAITRPSQEGESLKRIYKNLSLSQKIPDLIIAHGTATLENDKIEDYALSEAFKNTRSPSVTTTKWSIGHTLGTSGAMDLIAAAEVLKNQQTFCIASTIKTDENFRMNYLSKNREWKNEKPLERVLIDSLGFGGAHAALLLNLPCGDAKSCVSTNVATNIPFVETQDFASLQKNLKFQYFSEDISFPPQEIPHWATSVARWHQMDAASFSLVQAYQLLKEKVQIPSFIILASPTASHEADFDFIKSGAKSPSKMIHTLPSSRASSLCQAMNWSGPLLCLQKDLLTQKAGIHEAADLVSEEYPSVWVLGVAKISRGKYQVQLCEMTLAAENLFQDIPVSLLQDVLPHRPPLLWIDQVVWSQENEGVCSVILKKNAHYFDSQKVRASSFLEWMAQAYGFIRACSVLTQNETSQKLKKTYLAAVNDFEIFEENEIHLVEDKKLSIHIKTVKDLSPLFSIAGEIRTEEGIVLAKGNLKVYAE